VQKSATTAQADPLADRRKELDEREQTLAEQGRKEFFKGVRGEVNTQVTRAINTQLVSVLKGRKMDAPVRNRLMGEITSALASKVHSDPTYAKQQPGIMASGDRDRAIKFNMAAYSRALPNVIKEVLKDPVWVKYFGGSAPPRVAAPKNGA